MNLNLSEGCSCFIHMYAYFTYAPNWMFSGFLVSAAVSTFPGYESESFWWLQSFYRHACLYSITSMMRSAAFPFSRQISFLRFVGFGLILVHRALLACRNFDNLCELEDNAVGCTPLSLRVNYKRFLHFGTRLLFLLHLTDTSSLLFFFLPMVLVIGLQLCFAMGWI